MLRCAYRSFPLRITLIVRSIDRLFATSSLLSIAEIIFFSPLPFALETNICLYLLSEDDDEDKPAAPTKEKIYHSTPSPILPIVATERCARLAVFLIQDKCIFHHHRIVAKRGRERVPNGHAVQMSNQETSDIVDASDWNVFVIPTIDLQRRPRAKRRKKRFLLHSTNSISMIFHRLCSISRFRFLYRTIYTAQADASPMAIYRKKVAAHEVRRFFFSHSERFRSRTMNFS